MYTPQPSVQCPSPSACSLPFQLHPRAQAASSSGSPSPAPPVEILPSLSSPSPHRGVPDPHTASPFLPTLRLLHILHLPGATRHTPARAGPPLLYYLGSSLGSFLSCLSPIPRVPHIKGAPYSFLPSAPLAAAVPLCNSQPLEGSGLLEEPGRLPVAVGASVGTKR